MHKTGMFPQVLEGKPIYADCFGNLVPLTKSGQHHLFSFFAFKENRLALFIKVSAAEFKYRFLSSFKFLEQLLDVTVLD